MAGTLPPGHVEVGRLDLDVASDGSHERLVLRHHRLDVIATRRDRESLHRFADAVIYGAFGVSTPNGYFTSPLAARFTHPLEDDPHLIVPPVVFYLRLREPLPFPMIFSLQLEGCFL